MSCLSDPEMNSSSWLRSFRPSISPPHQSRIARRGNQQAMTFSTTPTVSMSNPADRVEIITSVQRRRRWTAAEKVRIVEETFEPGMTVSLVARRHGVAPNQLFTWCRLVVEGALTAAGSGEQVVPASDFAAAHEMRRRWLWEQLVPDMVDVYREFLPQSFGLPGRTQPMVKHAV